MQDLLAKAGIEDFDLLLVGDGSGSKWGYGAGWASVAIEPDLMGRKSFYGACNNATVNFAELMAYMAPLSWYVSHVKDQKKQPRRGGLFQIHIITDSQYARGSSDRESVIAKTHNFLLLSGLSTLGHKGFNLNWHWMERETSELNRFVDELSRSSRVALQEADVPDKTTQITGLRADTANPWE